MKLFEFYQVEEYVEGTMDAALEDLNMYHAAFEAHDCLVTLEQHNYYENPELYNSIRYNALESIGLDGHSEFTAESLMDKIKSAGSAIWKTIMKIINGIIAKLKALKEWVFGKKKEDGTTAAQVAANQKKADFTGPSPFKGTKKNPGFTGPPEKGTEYLGAGHYKPQKNAYGNIAHVVSKLPAIGRCELAFSTISIAHTGGFSVSKPKNGDFTVDHGNGDKSSKASVTDAPKASVPQIAYRSTIDELLKLGDKVTASLKSLTSGTTANKEVKNSHHHQLFVSMLRFVKVDADRIDKAVKDLQANIPAADVAP